MLDMSKFKFYTPLEIRKGKDKSGKSVMKLGGIASTIDEDSDGEFLDPSGFEIADFETVGVVNWHHQAKDKPSTIIGEPAFAEIREDGFYVETELYPSSETAREVYELAEVLEKDSKTRRLGYSIEGVVLERGSDDENHPDYKIVKKAQITGLAITHMPKNPQTFAQIIKGKMDTLNEDDSEEDTEKSLNTESGAALMPESVDGSKEKNKDNLKLVKSNYKVSTLSERDMYLKIFDTFSDIKLEKAKKIYSFLTKINDVMAKNNVSDADLEKAMSHFGLGDNAENPFLEKSEKTDSESPDEVLSKSKEDNMDKGGYDKADGDMKKSSDEEDEDDSMKKDHSADNGGEATVMEKSKTADPLKGTTLILKKSIEKAQNSNNENSKQLATLIKAQMDQNTLLKGQVETLSTTVTEQQELIKGLSEKVGKLGGAPRARKSLVKGYSEKESFAKAKEQEAANANVLSMKGNYQQILDVLDGASMSKGGYDEEFGKACMSFETNKTLPSSIITRLKTEKGLVIVD